MILLTLTNDTTLSFPFRESVRLFLHENHHIQIKHLEGDEICKEANCWNPLHLCFSCGEDVADLVHPTFSHDWIYDCPKCRKEATGFTECNNIKEINHINENIVKMENRKLKAKWSIEKEQDMEFWIKSRQVNNSTYPDNSHQLKIA